MEQNRVVIDKDKKREGSDCQGSACFGFWINNSNIEYLAQCKINDTFF